MFSLFLIVLLLFLIEIYMLPAVTVAQEPSTNLGTCFACDLLCPVIFPRKPYLPHDRVQVHLVLASWMQLVSSFDEMLTGRAWQGTHLDRVSLNSLSRNCNILYPYFSTKSDFSIELQKPSLWKFVIVKCDILIRVWSLQHVKMTDFISLNLSHNKNNIITAATPHHCSNPLLLFTILLLQFLSRVDVVITLAAPPLCLPQPQLPAGDSVAPTSSQADEMQHTFVIIMINPLRPNTTNCLQITLAKTQKIFYSSCCCSHKCPVEGLCV